MDINERKRKLNELYYSLLSAGKVANKKDLAEQLGVSYAYICNSFGVDKRFPTPALLARVRSLVNQSDDNAVFATVYQIPLVPMETSAIILSKFRDNMKECKCERINSPISGVDFALRIPDDSMAPEYGKGDIIFIKKVESGSFIEYGKTYVVDTVNGVLIKILYPTLNNPDALKCVSINSQYPPYEVKKEHINGLYKIILAMVFK